MKKRHIHKATLIFFIVCWAAISAMAQGKFAGAYKALIGKKYKRSSDIAMLKNFPVREGSLVSGINDEEQITADVFRKGTTAVVFFSKKAAGDSLYQVYDVLEVKDIVKGWEVKTGLCRQNGSANVEIVALVKWSPDKEFLREVKRAWRFNRDKLRFEKLDNKGIDCINEGLE